MGDGTNPHRFATIAGETPALQDVPRPPFDIESATNPSSAGGFFDSDRVDDTHPRCVATLLLDDEGSNGLGASDGEGSTLRACDNDHTGVGVYSGRFSDHLPDQGSETVIELNYGIQATPWFYLTPDIQYVINPGGSDDIPNALVIGFEVGITF